MHDPDKTPPIELIVGDRIALEKRIDVQVAERKVEIKNIHHRLDDAVKHAEKLAWRMVVLSIVVAFVMGLAALSVALQIIRMVKYGPGMVIMK